MTEPAQKPGRSKQDFSTPDLFLDAVEQRFGAITFDLAASADNAAADRFFSKGGIDATTANWGEHLAPGDLCFINPEFGSIANVWAPLISYWAGQLPWLRVLMLAPASVGAEWFSRYVNGKAYVFGLSPRITFVGERDPYPKDLMLCVWIWGMNGFDGWRWQPPAKPRKRRSMLPGVPILANETLALPLRDTPEACDS